MDDIELFLSKADLGLEYATHNLVTENIRAERDFKLEVLEWLNNGQPKLFRSPTEGNYIVRLMNVTMSPTDTLGRMLHTFNCSAYEIDDYTYENLHKHGLLSVLNNVQYQMRWATVELSTISPEGKVEYFTGQVNIGNTYGELATRPVYHVSVSEMTPGTYFLIGKNKESAKKVFIGATGAYEINTTEPYNYIGIPEKDDFGNPVQWDGIITYGYKSQITSLFDLISKVEINDIPCRRIMGVTGDSLLTTLQDIKTTILAIRYVSFHLRGVYPIYVNKNDFNPQDRDSWFFYIDSNNLDYYSDIMEYPEHLDASIDNPIDRNRLASWNLYKVYFKRDNYSYRGVNEYGGQDSNYGDTNDSRNPTGEGYYIDRNGEMFSPFTGYYYDPISNQLCQDDGSIFSVNVNGEVVDLSETENLFVSGIDDYKILKAGAGIITDIGYQTQTSTYSFETTNLEVAGLKQAYVTALNRYLNMRGKQTMSDGEVNHAYLTFINRLTEVVRKYKEENSID